MRYYIESNKRITKKAAILSAIISLAIVLVLSALIFFFVDKMMGLSLLGMFLFFIAVILLICLFGKNNNEVTTPYIEIIDKEVVFFNHNSIEQKRIPLSDIYIAEITTAYRYRLHTIPEGRLSRYKQSLFAMIFEPKYIVFYDVNFNYLFGLYLCKENYEAFKNYLPQSKQSMNNL